MKLFSFPEMKTVKGPLYVLAAGGTGGHLFPAVALMRDLARRGGTPIFVTDQRGEKFLRQIPEKEFPGVLIVQDLPSQAQRRSLRGVFLFLCSFLKSFIFVWRFRPKAIVGFGGYPSAAMGVSAWLGWCPLILHEQNAVLGKTNRILSRFARILSLSYEETIGVPTAFSKKTQVVGLPVRDAFSELAPYKAWPKNESLKIFVLGGSQGARVFSDVVPQALSNLPVAFKQKIHVIHQIRKEELEKVSQFYKKSNVSCEVQSFFVDVSRKMEDAHLIITRGGASSLGEIVVAGRPCICVPYPWAANDHQSVNGSVIARHGGGWCVQETEFTSVFLQRFLEDVYENPGVLFYAAQNILRLKKPKAASVLGDLVWACVENKSGR